MAEQKRVNDYLTLCQSWQTAINRQTTTDAKRITVTEAFNALKNQTFHGSRKVVVHGEGVMYVPDGVAPLEEALWPRMQFREVQTEGWLGRLYALPHKNEFTLTWPIYDAHVLGPVQDEEIVINPGTTEGDELMYPLPLGTRLNRPLHFPVGLIDYALCYSK
jgi:hypothetical protein